MADKTNFDVNPLKPYVLRSERGFIVFNMGKTTERVPEKHREELIRNGVINRDGTGGETPDDGLDGLTRAKLIALAGERNVAVETDANKASLLETLRSAGVSAPTSSDAPTE